jgi:hypothetical protein
MNVQGRLRRRRPVILVAAVLGLMLVALGIYWFGPQHLFQNRTAAEAFPVPITHGADLPTGAKGSPSRTSSSQAEVLAEGTFRSLAHQGSGLAAIVATADGRAFLRIEDLDVLSGPDLRVYLSAAPGDADDAAFGEQLVVDLGGLRANKGDLTYEIPSDADLESVRSVAIWCRRFSVGFAVAGLM